MLTLPVSHLDLQNTVLFSSTAITEVYITFYLLIRLPDHVIINVCMYCFNLMN